MKTQVQFRQTDSDEGVALLDGSITSLEQAKIALAGKLGLPAVNTPQGAQEDIDVRLRNGGIDPASVSFDQIAE
ncbi:hypothetical protein V0R37_18425 [Pollutimonas sp. H1-120]|uniref:hypothetical protein n=1 Tax=Pollutimonas sp. H1-120 TaxID=3148824 RepID=UPI003B51F56D